MARAAPRQPTFVTKRLQLRPFRASDGDAMHPLYGDADNLRYWNVPPSSDAASSRRALRWHLAYRPRNYVMWAVALAVEVSMYTLFANLFGSYPIRVAVHSCLFIGFLVLSFMEWRRNLAE